MRNLIILVLVVVALMVVKSIVSQIVGAVSKGLRAQSDARGAASEKQTAASSNASGRLVKDPVSGVYIDEKLAVKEIINGKAFFFESNANRDAYLKKHAG